jgi:nitroreductase
MISEHTTQTWLNCATFEQVVATAIRAPSMHNSQPWRFRLRGATIDVIADEGRRLPVADPTGWAVRLSCGAAIYNLRLALAAAGTPATVRLLPNPVDRTVLASLTPAPARPPTPEETRLHRAIPRRHTNRFPFTDEPVSPAVRAALVAAARAEGAWLDLLAAPAAVEIVAELARVADAMLGRDDAYRVETATWARPHVGAPDGVPVAAGGPAPQAFELLKRRGFGDAGDERPREFEREPLVGVLGVAGSAPVDDIQAGQALQHVLLTATDLGLAASMVSQPVEVESVREQLRLALRRSGSPQMVLRLGYSAPVPSTVGRRPVSDVIASS